MGKCVEQRQQQQSQQPILVYDLDALLMDRRANSQPMEMIDLSQINDPEPLIDSEHSQLHFESRFESGNLRRVFQV